MSFNQKHSCDKRHKRRAGSVPLERRGRYDVWSRAQSDTFRSKVAVALVNRAGINLDLNSDPYSTLLAIPDPRWSEDSFNHALSICQLKALFQKDEDLRSPIDKEQVAFQAYLDSEAKCKLVNDAFLDSQLSITNGDAGCILSYAQRKIAEILGDAPLITSLKPSFGPGSAVTCRQKTSARFKLSTLPSICKPSLSVLFQMAQGVRRWIDHHKGIVQVVAGVLEFVPKNYKTHRAIVIGPSLTGMYQRAVGSVMKQKLLRAGIDLFGGKTSPTGGQARPHRALNWSS